MKEVVLTCLREKDSNSSSSFSMPRSSWKSIVRTTIEESGSTSSLPTSGSLFRGETLTLFLCRKVFTIDIACLPALETKCLIFNTSAIGQALFSLADISSTKDSSSTNLTTDQLSKERFSFSTALSDSCRTETKKQFTPNVESSDSNSQMAIALWTKRSRLLTNCLATSRVPLNPALQCLPTLGTFRLLRQVVILNSRLIEILIILNNV